MYIIGEKIHIISERVKEALKARDDKCFQELAVRQEEAGALAGVLPHAEAPGSSRRRARLMQDLGCATEKDLWERLEVDKCIHLSIPHPMATEETWHVQSQFSVWHIGTKLVEYGDGLGVYEETNYSPLAGAESVRHVERFDWPDPEAWDVSGLRTQCEIWRDYPILAGSYEPFYLYCRLRGMEQAMEDLVEKPQIAEAALERIYFIHEELIRRILDEAGDLIDLVYVGVLEHFVLLGVQEPDIGAIGYEVDQFGLARVVEGQLVERLV